MSFAPDLTRPLRTDPVRRDEVLIDSEWQLLTTPLGTWTSETRPWFTGNDGQQHTEKMLVGDSALWQPLLDELTPALATEFVERQKAIIEETAQHPQLRAVLSAPKKRRVPKPEFGFREAIEYVCESCCGRYLGRALFGNKQRRVRVCSNRCERARRNALQRQWRRYHPPDYEEINAARAARRAEARAGRTCEHCGQSLVEAARSTRRFCSDICRVMWHHRSPDSDPRSSRVAGEKPQ